MASYRIQFTEVKPGGHRDRQDDLIKGTLEDVRDYLDRHSVWGRDPIVITEHTKSDGLGRIVPASEWDVIDD